VRIDTQLHRYDLSALASDWVLMPIARNRDIVATDIEQEGSVIGMMYAQE